MIRNLQAEGYIQPNCGSVPYIKSDGCPAQYKCAVALYLVGLLAKAFGIQIDYMVTAAHHGKSLVDAIAGKDKYEIANALIQGMSEADRNEFYERLSSADKCAKWLSRHDRGEGASLKHTKIDGKRHLTHRQYDVSNYDVKGIPAGGCFFDIKSNQVNWNVQPWKNPNEKNRSQWHQNQLGEMHHFRFHYLMPNNMAAVRRIPCLCSGTSGCFEQLSFPWDSSKNLQQQPMFQRSPKCFFAPLMREEITKKKIEAAPKHPNDTLIFDLNEWNFVRIDQVETSTTTQEGLTEIYRDFLSNRISNMEPNIRPTAFGAIRCKNDGVHAKDGIRLVQFASGAFCLQEDRNVEGYSDPQPTGTVVAKCIFWDHVIGQGWD